MNLPRRIFALAAPAVALAAAVVAGSGAVAQAASSPAAQIKPFNGVFTQISNVGNGMCLQPVTPVPNSAVVQEPCVPPSDTNFTDHAMQGWQTVNLGGHTGFLNQASGDCLFAFIGAQDGAPMGLNTCRTVSNEQFDTHANVPNVVELESLIGFSDSGFCMDVPGASKTPGLQLQLFDCNGSLAQRWVVGFTAS